MKKLFSLLAAVLFTGSMFAVYNAVKVTSVHDGGLYIFERDGRVMIGSVSNYVIQTTDDYSKAGLQGIETYVWSLHSLEDPSDCFMIRNEARYAETPLGHVELSNQSNSANMTFANAATSAWRFTFDTDGTATITNAANNDRFIGDNGSNGYKCYAQSNIGSTPHLFTIYELTESSDPFLTVNKSVIDFGNIVEGESVDDAAVKVIFANLTGSITYSGLTAPFSASGSISATGDEITISATASTIGDYEQTLTIASAADSKSATVTVKMKVIEAPDPNASFSLFSGDLVEGDYVIYDAQGAMNTTLSSDRLQITDVTPENDMISSPDASIVWHIAPSGGYWTIYNASEQKYAAGTEVKNKIQLLADGTDDKALWTATNTSGSYTFVNKANAAKSVNATLKRNGTFGWACYASGSVTLYKKGNGGTTALDEAAAAHKAIKRIENGQIIIIRDGKRFNAIGARIE